jgi:hypothetical protein
VELAACWVVWVAGEGTIKSHLSDEVEIDGLAELELAPLEEPAPDESTN